MADDSDKSSSEAQDDALRKSLLKRLASAPSRLLSWAGSGRIPMAISGTLGLIVVGGVFAVWSYLAHLAVDAPRAINLKDALVALDDGDMERAKSLIGELQDEPAEPTLLGGALFVLGIVKSSEADAEYSPERRRAMHLVAGRYLRKAYSLGFPPGRELQGAYHLGRSLILGNQQRSGITVLEEVLEDPEAPADDVRALLVEAELASAVPDLESAMRHNGQVLASSSISPEQRIRAQLWDVEILLRLKRFGEARTSISQLDPAMQEQPSVQLMLGQIAVQEGSLESDPARRQSSLKDAIARLRETQRSAPRGSELTRRAMYWIGRAYQAGGDEVAAGEQFDRISKQFGDAAEGVAATLAIAEAELAKGRAERALALYRQVLETIGDPTTYANPLVSLAELRKQLLTAFQRFLTEQQYAAALALVDQMEPIFSRAEQVEFRAETNQQWGTALITEAEEADQWDVTSGRKEGRRLYRTAGRAYEELARLRFSTRFFTEDLWSAAEAYFQGQSYSNASRTYKEFLHHESRLKNSTALLRLGQSQLAARNPAGAISSLEECIEMYPRDGVIYMARLEAARAYQQLGNPVKAEALLQTNLTGDALTPKSPEWRDSLFELGQMLYDLGRYDEAVEELTHAVDRYPNAEQSILALYTIARAHHSASDAPLTRLRASKTETERQKNRRLVNSSLERALEAYRAVQQLITLNGHGENNPLHRTILRNCYMMQGSVLYTLERFEEARQAYSNVSGLYQNEPFVLESFIKIADCWRRLNEPVKARGTIEQAKLALQRLPPETDFRIATNFSRQQWKTMLDQMSQW